MKKTIQYHVTTIHGQSESNYSHQSNSPVHKSGQGLGNVGSEWDSISILILITMSQIEEGCEITGPQKCMEKDNNKIC